MQYLTPADYETAERNGVNKVTLERRYYTYKWDKERSTTEPVEKERAKWMKIAHQNGISTGTFDNRYNMYGWTYKQAATMPLNTRLQSEHRFYLKRAKENGINQNTYFSRLRYGYSKEKACTKPVRKRVVS